MSRALKPNFSSKKMNYRKNILFVVFAALIFNFLPACRSKRIETSPQVITGVASWYGPQFHGRTTSSQEIFDMYDMTAAHKRLPFGTQVMVTNLNNGRSVKVRINDRGPFIRGRDIDLSYAAAKALGMVRPGIVPVRMEILTGISEDTAQPEFAVQVGAFVNKKNALSLKSQLHKKYNNVYVSLFKTPHRSYYRVRLNFSSKKNALMTARELQRKGFEVFIVEYQD
ncbi:MAG: septal ring lytic transglycosylase RlpA family protein [Candidatus Aminicenantes bacterium]|nr:septal ring lytic transglycosylase RlpA family protein [Candidatus Aminicenantes bacterium]